MFKHRLIFLLILMVSGYTFSQNQVDSDGKRHGHWKVNFEGTSNPKFEGNFEHGQEVGTFKFYKKGFYDHPSAILNFEKGRDSVQATYYTQQGKPISEGKLIDRKREGKWVYYHQKSDSIMMTEFYRNDKLHGLQKTYYTNGQLAEKTSYVEGVRHGESCIYAKNGQATKQLNYQHGQLHGPVLHFTPKGEKTLEGNYTEGEKSGTWKYYIDGKLDREEEY